MAVLDVGKRKPSMASPDISHHQFHYRPAAASIADAPRSAPSAPCRMKANSSRPVPNGDGGAAASLRASHTAGVDQRAQLAAIGAETDDIPVAELGERPTAQRLGGDMDRGGDLARRPRHPPVGDQGYLEAPILQHAERRRELVQLRHPIRPRALEAHHHDNVAIEFASL